MTYRTDRNNNPIAFTTDVAKEGGLDFDTEWVAGDSFIAPASNHIYYTAKLIGDPVAVCIKLIDSAGFYTKYGQQRWTYIGIPKFIWDSLTLVQKTRVIGFMYQREGGVAMLPLFIKV